MNDEQIDGLKQFIATIITQQTTDLREDISEIREDISGLKSGVKRLDGKIDDLSHSVAEALDNSNEETEKRLSNHELRITKLEAKAA